MVVGCVSRSVRDTARWFDVCNGCDSRDTLSLPRVAGWEAGLDSFDLAGKRAVVAVDLGSAIVEPRAAALVVELAEALIAEAGLIRVDVVVQLPQGGLEWAMSNLIGLAGGLGDRYPGCNDDLTPEIQFGMNLATHHLDVQSAGKTEISGSTSTRQMADIFDRADFVFAATNPDRPSAPAAPCPPPSGDVDLIAEYGFDRAMGNNGALTIPANLTGNPAVSIPAGTVDGCPSGCRSSAATTRSSSCWTWPASSSGSAPGLVAPPHGRPAARPPGRRGRSGRQPMRVELWVPTANPSPRRSCWPSSGGGRGARHLVPCGSASTWSSSTVRLLVSLRRGRPHPAPPVPGLLEPLSTLSFLAAHTTTVRLGTAMVLLPQRNPVYTAKEVSTLDWLSNGRVDLGIGVGWLEEEFEALNVSWPHAGRRTDEYLEVLPTLWSDETSAVRGRVLLPESVPMFPKPVQHPTPHPHRRRERRRPPPDGPGRPGVAHLQPHARGAGRAAGQARPPVADQGRSR